MSKAFTRESDDVPEPRKVTRPLSVPGGKNYMTPGSEKKLRRELDELANQPDAQASPDRIVHLQQSLAEAIVVPAPPQPWEQVLFGATVTVRDQTGRESKYRIVGMDETDLDQNWIGWTSPLARALLKSQLGQEVKFKTPAGEQNWKIVAISYE